MARWTLVIPEAHSLKEKRMVLRRIKDRVRERVGVVVNEVGAQDQWQRAELGCAVASGDRQQALGVIDHVVRIAMAAGGSQIVGIAKESLKFEGASVAPDLVVDDRTGAADKAAGQGETDWIPDAWRDDAER